MGRERSPAAGHRGGRAVVATFPSAPPAASLVLSEQARGPVSRTSGYHRHNKWMHSCFLINLAYKCKQKHENFEMHWILERGATYRRSLLQPSNFSLSGTNFITHKSTLVTKVFFKSLPAAPILLVSRKLNSCYLGKIELDWEEEFLFLLYILLYDFIILWERVQSF